MLTPYQWAQKAATDYCGGEPCEKVACIKTVEEIVDQAVSDGRAHCAKFAARLLARISADARAVATADQERRDPKLAEQWADVIACSLPTFASPDDFDAARKTIGEYVAMILANPGKFNGFSSRDGKD